MKRIISLIIASCLLAGSLFAENFFSKRYVEVRANVPVNISNNILSMNDIMVENLVIDLSKMAETAPENGFNLTAVANPNVSLNFNFPLFTLGFKTEVDVNASVGIDKGLFDFLGKGYKVGETATINMDVKADVFLTETVSVGFKIGDFMVTARPTVFKPILHVVPEYAYVKATNKENGDVNLQASTRLDVYSAVPFDGQLKIDSSVLNLGNTLGFDMGATISYPFREHLFFWGDVRVPIVPGHLTNYTSYSADFKYEGNAGKMITGDFGSNETTTDDFSELKWSETDYYIHRPLKFELYATFTPFPDVISVTGGVGFGINNPFAKNANEVKFYPEYYLQGQVGLANIIVLQASTEYMNQIFKHQLGFVFNLRLIEVDAGVSLQASDFIKSWTGTGLGAYVTACVGF